MYKMSHPPVLVLNTVETVLIKFEIASILYLRTSKEIETIFCLLAHYSSQVLSTK